MPLNRSLHAGSVTAWMKVPECARFPFCGHWGGCSFASCCMAGISEGNELERKSKMRKAFGIVLVVFALLGTAPAFAQVKMTRDQILFYTSDWKGDRFPDGRPKLPDSLLKRAVNLSIEDVWEYLRGQGYSNQFEGGWQALHIDKPFAGRALTAQYMPTRPDMRKAITAEGRAEGRVSGTNSWPINELQIGDVYVADGFGKVFEGTLIGSNLGNGVAAHTHTGFVFDGGIRDQEENRAIPDFNGFYRGYDPSAWANMELTGSIAPFASAKRWCCRVTWFWPRLKASFLFPQSSLKMPSAMPNSPTSPTTITSS